MKNRLADAAPARPGAPDERAGRSGPVSLFRCSPRRRRASTLSFIMLAPSEPVGGRHTNGGQRIREPSPRPLMKPNQATSSLVSSASTEIREQASLSFPARGCEKFPGHQKWLKMVVGMHFTAGPRSWSASSPRWKRTPRIKRFALTSVEDLLTHALRPRGSRARHATQHMALSLPHSATLPCTIGGRLRYQSALSESEGYVQYCLAQDCCWVALTHAMPDLHALLQCGLKRPR